MSEDGLCPDDGLADADEENGEGGIGISRVHVLTPSRRACSSSLVFISEWEQ